MTRVVNYLFESGISLSLFALIFLLFLRKETFFRTNRLYLLFSVLFSLALPLIAIPVYTAEPLTLPEITVTPYRNLLETIIVNSRQISGNVENFVISSRMVVGLWLVGVILMTVIIETTENSIKVSTSIYSWHWDRESDLFCIYDERQ